MGPIFTASQKSPMPGMEPGSGSNAGLRLSCKLKIGRRLSVLRAESYCVYLVCAFLQGLDLLSLGNDWTRKRTSRAVSIRRTLLITAGSMSVLYELKRSIAECENCWRV